MSESGASTYLFLFHLNLHNGMNEVGPNAEGVELNATVCIAAAFARAATRERHSVNLALDSGLMARTRS